MDFPDIETNNGIKISLTDTDSMMGVVEWVSTNDITNIEVIIPKSSVRKVRRNFPLNSKLAEVIENNEVNVYSTKTTSLPTLIHNNESLYYLVRFGELEKFIETSRKGVVAGVEEEFHLVSGSANKIEVDILAWGELLEQLEETVSSSTRQEFERLIEAARIESLGALDDISVAIIAAAQSEALLNDLGKWAEEVGLASKATFSRRKKKLEENGVIYTEKVPVDIGRPRLRLKLADDINSVNIQHDEIDISRDETGPNSTTPDETGRSLETREEQPDNMTQDGEEEDVNNILTNLEQEIQDAITSK